MQDTIAKLEEEQKQTQESFDKLEGLRKQHVATVQQILTEQARLQGEFRKVASLLEFFRQKADGNHPEASLAEVKKKVAKN